MNLKTWFKGLGVFVLSSLITSLAAINLSPATFNFSKQGMIKLGMLALVIGLKSVLLYLKQSPLPYSGGITDWTKIGGALALASALAVAPMISGCVSSWERNTYTTLAAGKALIDCAVAGYNHFDADIRRACAANPGDPGFDPSKFYLPQTRNAQQAIEKARQAQIAAVEGFEAYAVAKIGKDNTVPLAEKQAVVVGYLAQLPVLFDAVRSFMAAAPATASFKYIGIQPAPDVTTISPTNGQDLVAKVASLTPNTTCLSSRHQLISGVSLPNSLCANSGRITQSLDSQEVYLAQ